MRHKYKRKTKLYSENINILISAASNKNRHSYFSVRMTVFVDMAIYFKANTAI